MNRPRPPHTTMSGGKDSAPEGPGGPPVPAALALEVRPSRELSNLATGGLAPEFTNYHFGGEEEGGLVFVLLRGGKFVKRVTVPGLEGYVHVGRWADALSKAPRGGGGEGDLRHRQTLGLIASTLHYQSDFDSWCERERAEGKARFEGSANARAFREILRHGRHRPG